jgi:hypothetical protein
MKKFNFILITVIGAFIFLSCSDKEEKKETPSQILGIAKMADVVVALNISEALIMQNSQPLVKNKLDLSFNVFKENNVNRADFFKSMEYYSKNPELLKKIYESALDKLAQIKQKQ